MEKQAPTVSSLMDNVRDYMETRLDLYKLQAIDKTSSAVSSAVAGVAIAVIGTFAFVILNIGLALWIGDLIGRSYLGFFIVATFYFLVAFLLHIFKVQWIKDPISNSLIKKMLNK